jgi:glyoxylase-like metal-dependent hydrolase (beta-lactamase superfamily II)
LNAASGEPGEQLIRHTIRKQDFTMDIFHQQDQSVLYRLDDQVYFRVNAWEPNSECNSGYIVFSNHVAAIDATTDASVRDMMQETMHLFHKPLKKILLTHPHWDHVMGMGAVIEHDLELVCRQAAAEQLRQSGIPLPRRMTLFDQTLALIDDALHVRLFAEGCTTHSPWDMLIGLPDRGYVFSGDVCVTERMMFFGQSDVTSWIDFLPTLKSYQLILRGHGDAADPASIDRQVAYLRELKATCLRLIELELDQAGALANALADARINPSSSDDQLIGALVAMTGDQDIPHIEQLLQSGQFGYAPA